MPPGVGQGAFSRTVCALLPRSPLHSRGMSPARPAPTVGPARLGAPFRTADQSHEGPGAVATRTASGGRIAGCVRTVHTVDPRPETNNEKRDPDEHNTPKTPSAADTGRTVHKVEATNNQTFAQGGLYPTGKGVGGFVQDQEPKLHSSA